jgi:hypothetical protein
MSAISSLEKVNKRIVLQEKSKVNIKGKNDCSLGKE